MLAVQTSAGEPHGALSASAGSFSALTFLALISFLTTISASPLATSSADSLLSLVVLARSSATSAALAVEEASS